MSRGALKELIRATPKSFTRMIADVPPSEKRDITKIFKNYVEILGGQKIE